MIFYPRQCRLRTSLKVTFYFLFSLAQHFLETKFGILPGWADARAPNPHVYLSIPVGWLVSLPLFHPSLIVFWNRRRLLLGGHPLIACLFIF